MKAREQIEQGRMKGLDHNAIYELFLTAYGRKDWADKARLNAIWADVRRRTEAASSAHRQRKAKR